MAWPRSIRFRYSLRALLIFVTLFAFWGGYLANRAIKERCAVKVLVRHGASLASEPERRTDRYAAPANSLYDNIIARIWQTPRITHIDITTTLESDVVEAIEGLPHLHTVRLNASRASDGDHNDALQRRNIYGPVDAPTGSIASILSTHSLIVLSVDGFALSNRDFDAVTQHDSLRDLTLDRTNISESVFAQAVSLPRLRRFRCCYSNVTGKGLTSVRGPTTLSHIECKGVPLDTEFARFVTRCENVEYLCIAHKAIDDDFIAALRCHKRLCHLELWESSITDKSISVFLQMPSLTSITIMRSKMSEDGRRLLEGGRSDGGPLTVTPH